MSEIREGGRSAEGEKGGRKGGMDAADPSSVKSAEPHDMTAADADGPVHFRRGESSLTECVSQGSETCPANMVLGAVAICELITRGPEITVCSSASCTQGRRRREREQ